jgi:hypothetical protein
MQLRLGPGPKTLKKYLAFRGCPQSQPFCCLLMPYEINQSTCAEILIFSQFFRACKETSHREIIDGSSPNIRRALQAFQDELDLWQLASAKGLAALGLGRVVQ